MLINDWSTELNDRIRSRIENNPEEFGSLHTTLQWCLKRITPRRIEVKWNHRDLKSRHSLTWAALLIDLMLAIRRRLTENKLIFKIPRRNVV